MGPAIEIGPFTFTIIRILVLIGLIRILVRQEKPAGGVNSMDWLIFAWAAWSLFAGLFHDDSAGNLVFQLGLVYNTLGIYFLLRCFCQSIDDAAVLMKMIAILLIPIALEMANEQLTRRNLFSVFGAVSEVVMERDGKLRAQGPFRHAILAGTVGAVCMPFMAAIWRRYPTPAKLGITTCVLIVFLSNSSGPIMSLLFGIFAMLLWRWRTYTGRMRVALVVVYMLLLLVMKSPPYYLIARIDLTGSSTGWHRARLIESAFQHLNEWWLIGTDYTRHWMPTGVSWSTEHTDITNHYIKMGVLGGILLMLLFIAIIGCAFRYIGNSYRAQSSKEDAFIIWCLGSALFAHTATMISVSYFDQSFIFLYANLAAISSLNSLRSVVPMEQGFKRLFNRDPVNLSPKHSQH